MTGTEKKHQSTQSDKTDPVADPHQQKKADTIANARPDSSSAEVEIGGRKGLEPTRYGDWEKNGRCIDF
jgi:hypothetical protein